MTRVTSAGHGPAAQFAGMQGWDNIAVSSDLETTAEEREPTVAEARTVCRVLLVVTIGAALWMWFYPRPYPLPILVMLALPWVAVWVTAHYKGVVVINEKKREPHPGVGVAFIMPGLLTMIIALVSMNILRWQRPVVLTIIVSGFLTFAAWQADAAVRKQPWTALLLFLLALAYGYSFTMQANALLSRSHTQWYKTAVVSKRTSSGKTTSYYLRLQPWGPQPVESDVTVSHRFYSAKQPGDVVCVGLRAGALGIPYYFVRDCR
jgi:hypothetical protein